MPLSDAACRNAKPRDKPYKLGDEKGLYLLIGPGKYWRFDYRYLGRRKTLSFGVYPDVPLKLARARRDEARQLLARGIDPSAVRKSEKTAQTETLEAIAREWLHKFRYTWTPDHGARILRRLERDVFPWLGNRRIRDISAPELLAVLRRIEARGASDTAHRARQNCSQVFRFAIATGRAERDPAGDLRGALPPAVTQHHAAITEPRQVGGLLRAIEGYEGSFVVRCALRLAPLLFVRPGELRQAEWSEFDLAAAEWRIPATKMKQRDPHLVPLARQAVAILRELEPLTGRGRYVFPCVRTPKRGLSENSLNGALRRLGYTKAEMTAHGFRALACSILNEQGWLRDVIERQLAHAERSKVRAAYHRAEHLAERRRMMQAWADYLEKLRDG